MFSNELLDSSDGTVAGGDGEVINLEGKLVRVVHVNQTHLCCAQRDVVTKIFLLFRCFLWLVSELVNVWDSQVELAGSVVGGGSEVDEVLESPSHSLC